MKQYFNFIEFVTVVETGSFSKAAIKLGVSKSHISKKVTQLEDHLGVQLITRSTRKLLLTEIGNIYHQRCKAIMHDIQEAEALIVESKLVPQGVLNISLPTTLGEQMFMPLLASFMQLHPKLTVYAEITTRIIDFIDDEMDLAIRLGYLQDSNLMARKLAEAKWIVCASPVYIEKFGIPRSPAALHQHDCLTFGQHGYKEDMTWKFPSLKNNKCYKIRPTLVSNNGAALHTAALKGNGLIYLPEFFLHDDLAKKTLVQVLPECYQITPVSAIYPHSHHLSPKVRLCIDYLVDSLCQ